MAGRIRSIKPEILDDERSAGLSSDAWRLWVSMWLLADDHGRLRGAPVWLEGQVFWATKPRETLASLIEELARARVIITYEGDGQRYIEIRNWTKHQKVDKPSKPRIPPPSLNAELSLEEFARLSRDPRETLAPDPDLRPPIPTTDPDHLPDSPSAARGDFDFEAVYALYPRKEGRKKGLQRCRSLIKTRSKYDALMTATKNYAATVADVQYAKHFDTFLGCFEDYVDAAPLLAQHKNQKKPHRGGPREPIAALTIGGDREF